SAGHLSLDIASAREDQGAFSFDRKPTRLSLAVAASIAIDVAVLALLVFLSRQQLSKKEALAVRTPLKGLIWLTEAGPGGGGGGGGNRMKEPPRRAEAPGHDAVTVPAATQPKPDRPDAMLDPNPIQRLDIPVKSLASATDLVPGLLEAPAGPPTLSQGPGTGHGAGDGAGPGNGSGRGSGLGSGFDRGTGDGVSQPGTG